MLLVVALVLPLTVATEIQLEVVVHLLLGLVALVFCLQ
jgi:hypothetical protein